MLKNCLITNKAPFLLMFILLPSSREVIPQFNVLPLKILQIILFSLSIYQVPLKKMTPCYKNP